MKKTIFGQFSRLLILVSSISILAACGASDALDLVDDIDNPGGGIKTVGSVTVSGTDTSTIGSSFKPTVESIREVGGIQFATFGEVDINLGALSAVTRGLVVSFDANGTPMIVAYVVELSDGDIIYEYNLDCSANNCSGVNVNTATGEITLDDVIVLKDESVKGNPATGSVILNGSVTYVPL